MWNAMQAGTLAVGASTLDICSLGMRIWWLLIIYHVALALAIIGLFTKCVPYARDIYVLGNSPHGSRVIWSMNLLCENNHCLIT